MGPRSTLWGKADGRTWGIDVATGERDALRKKAEAAKAAREQAESLLEELREELEAKTAELDKLKSEKAKNQSAIRDAERELQVGILHFLFHYAVELTSTRTPKATFKVSARRHRPRARRPKRLSLLKSRAVATTVFWIVCSVSRRKVVSAASM